MYRRFIPALLSLLFILPVFPQDERGKLRTPGDGDWPIGFPTAEMDIRNGIPMEEISRIALFEARRTWDRVSPLTEIPCVDQDGNIVAFYAVFKIHSDEDSVPNFTGKSYREITRVIREAGQRYREVQRALQRAQVEMDRRINEVERVEEKKAFRYRESDGEEISEPQVMSIPATPEYREAYRRVEENRKQRTGAGEYGTVLVSARSDLIPVPVVMHGLPPFYTRGDMLQAKAKESIGGEPELMRIYMGGPLDQWFEFLNEKGKSVLVDPFRGTTHSSNDIMDLMPKEIRMKADSKTVDRKWRALLQDSRREQ